MRIRTIDNFLDVDQKLFALSVIEDRAIPSVIDGFKPVQRKIIYMANKIWKTGSEKSMKVFQLGGQVSSLALYEHGDASMNSSIISMNQTFKNNLPLLDGYGQYGNLKVPVAGQPRYVGTKLSKNFRMVYKDFDLLENKIDEGCVIEPDYFLPIIPMVLVNGGEGIAVGYSSNIFNRNPLEITEACINCVKGKKVGELKPFLWDFTGDYIRDKDNPNKWYIKGKYKVINTTTVQVTELPPDVTFEKYEEYLDGLVEKKTIVDYENNSSTNVNYILKFTRSDLKKRMDDGTLETLLKVNGSDTENLTTLDENGHLKIFEKAEDIVTWFCSFRLKWYDKRKTHLIKTINDEITMLNEKARFLKAIIDKKLKIGNLPKKDVLDWLEKNKFAKFGGGYDYLTSMPIHNLTKERYEEILKQTDKKKIELKEVEAKTPKDMYLADLAELKKNLSKSK